MKKCFYALICAMIIITAGGCNSSKSIEETLKAIRNYSNKVMVGVGLLYDEYRGLDKKCYDKNGNTKTCDRIMDTPKNEYDLIVMNELDSNEKLSAHIKNDEINSIIYDNVKGSYIIDLLNNKESIMLNDHDYCFVYIKGEANKDSLTEECSSIYKEDAKKIQDSYEGMLSKIGISENDFEDFAQWYADDEGKKLIEKISKEKEQQKELTPNEVKEILSKEFKIITTEGGILLENSLGHDQIMFISSDSIGIVYSSKTYDGISLYKYENGNNIVASKDMKCAYSINDEITLNEHKCTPEQIQDSEYLSSSFNRILEKNKITINELFNFFKNYEK